MENKTIVVHCAGGAGISIADKIYKFLDDSDNEYKSRLIFNCIDSSDANYKDTKHLKNVGELNKIENINVSQSFLDGSGGIRAHASGSIVTGVQKYLDKKKYLSPKKNEIHVIIASAGGGSGNVIATMLLSNLMTKEIPTVLILVGDSSNAKAAENTRKALMSISDVSSRFSRAVSLRYYLNNYAEAPSLKEAQADNDSQIAILLDFLRIFNGDLKDLDYQDLVNLINPVAKDFDIPNGVYSLIAKVGVSNTNNLDEDLFPIINRTIIQDSNTYKPLEIAHSKVGYIENTELRENVAILHDKNNLTLSLVAGGLQSEINRLEEIEVRIKKSLEKTRDAIKIDNSIKADDNGLIF